MPVKDGIEAAAEIAGEQIAPVIILTAYSDRELIQRALDAGAMTYLGKPFSSATLLPAIELAAARYAETVALRAEIADANERLVARKVIDRAKGVLMTQGKDDRAAGVPMVAANRDGPQDIDGLGRQRRDRATAGQRQLITRQLITRQLITRLVQGKDTVR